MGFECVLILINLINPYSVDIVRVLDNVKLQASRFIILGMTSIFFYSIYKLFLEPFLDLDWNVNDVHYASFSTMIAMAKDTSKVAYVVVEVLMISLDKSSPYRIECIFANSELSMAFG